MVGTIPTRQIDRGRLGVAQDPAPRNVPPGTRRRLHVRGTSAPASRRRRLVQGGECAARLRRGALSIRDHLRHTIAVEREAATLLNAARAADSHRAAGTPTLRRSSGGRCLYRRSHAPISKRQAPSLLSLYFRVARELRGNPRAPSESTTHPLCANIRRKPRCGRRIDGRDL